MMWTLISIPYHSRKRLRLLIKAEWCMHASVREALTVSDNSLSPVRHQAITRINADFFSTEHPGTNVSEIKNEKQRFELINFEMSSAKCRPFRLDLDALSHIICNFL